MINKYFLSESFYLHSDLQLSYNLLSPIIHDQNHVSPFNVNKLMHIHNMYKVLVYFINQVMRIYQMVAFEKDCFIESCRSSDSRLVL